MACTKKFLRNRWQREYRLKNRIVLLKKRRKYEKNRRKKDPIFRMQRNMSSAMSSAISGFRKSQRTMDIIGCSVEELYQHFESCSSWEPWMTKENYGRNGWDVDHIIAISKWDSNCPLQFALCWDKSNLQPLDHIANIKKGNK